MPKNSAAFWRGEFKTVCFDSFILLGDTFVKQIHQGHKSPFRRAQDRFRRILISERMIFAKQKRPEPRVRRRFRVKGDIAHHEE